MLLSTKRQTWKCLMMTKTVKGAENNTFEREKNTFLLASYFKIALD